MVDRRRVVITGMGIVSPIGIGNDSVWKSLAERRSGVATLGLLEDTPLAVRFGGRVNDFAPKQYVKPRKSLKVMSRAPNKRSSIRTG